MYKESTYYQIQDMAQSTLCRTINPICLSEILKSDRYQLVRQVWFDCATGILSNDIGENYITDLLLIFIIMKSHQVES